jgi:DNA-binding MarR family transcriptional regulator
MYLPERPTTNRIEPLSDREIPKIAPQRNFLVAAVVLNQTTDFYRASLKLALKNLDLTISQWSVLWMLLISDNRMTPGKVAPLLPLKIHSVGLVINGLVERKLIRRKRSTKDRRSLEITLTQLGHDTAVEAADRVRKLIIDEFNVLSNEELQLFIGLARKVRDAAASRMGYKQEKVDLIEREVIGSIHARNKQR